MRRKDGRTKRKAIRSMPVYSCGFRDAESEVPLHPQLTGSGVARKAWSVTSLFAGCGGLDLGFLGGFRFLGKHYPVLPFHIEGAFDNSQDAVETYNLNLAPHAQLADLETLPASVLPATDVLLGGFPCQDFSSSGPKTGLSGRRGRLYRAMVDYAKRHEPKVIVAENVPHLARLDGGQHLREILGEFEDVGYRFDVWDLYGPHYGLPQSRRRLFLVGARIGSAILPIRPRTDPHMTLPTIDKALADLEVVNDETVPNQSQYFVATAATAGGGQGDHRNEAGKVAYCIRANSRGRIQFHYSLDRRLTVRECARLQSFPDSFVFPFSTQRNLTLIGNAVPPTLGHAVANAIASSLSDEAQASSSNPASPFEEIRSGQRQSSLF